nr:Putative membrane protein yuiD [Ipomoea batatas]
MALLSRSWGFQGALPSRNHTSSFHTESRGPNNMAFKVAYPFPRQGTGGCSTSHSFKLASLGNGVDGITDIIHNKVLIAAALSAAIGQLSKPFTSTIFYGNDFDIRTAFQAGGFPSTHSSFYLTKFELFAKDRPLLPQPPPLALKDIEKRVSLFINIVQPFKVKSCHREKGGRGVRREVGIHAKVLNQLLSETCLNTSSSHNGAAVSTDNSQEKSPSSVQILEPSMSEELNSFEPELKKNAALFLKPDNQKTLMSISQNMASDAEDRSKPLRYTQLKESIGHTEIQVVAGALLGFLVSLAVCMV